MVLKGNSEMEKSAVIKTVLFFILLDSCKRTSAETAKNQIFIVLMSLIQKTQVSWGKIKQEFYSLYIGYTSVVC